MRAASYAVSWVVGITKIIIGFIILSLGQNAAQTVYYYGYSYTTYTNVPYSGLVWGLWITYVIVGFLVLITRRFFINEGSRLGIGLMTLIFVSIIGGIFTFLIPLEYEESESYVLEKEDSSINLKTEDSADLIAKYKKLYDDGAITKEEYEQKKKQLLSL